MKDQVRVAGILPFWRYAVGPDSNSNPAIPFFRLSIAQKFFKEVQKDLPCAGAYLYQRRGRNGIEVIDKYHPKSLEELKKEHNDRQREKNKS